MLRVKQLKHMSKLHKRKDKKRHKREGKKLAQSVQNSPNKKGLTSKAWKYFRREQIDEKWKAICKYCERKIGGDTKQGTKHLYDHIRICPIHTVRGPKQSILKTMQQSSDGEWNPQKTRKTWGMEMGAIILPQQKMKRGRGQDLKAGTGNREASPAPPH
ncbi:hypothetical protein Ahy_B05g074089 [Arachis hypogaea]|uniref:BED-type domain-containing protein n=1 Tax=Arachis hypogaea TaxID=3818 RepID=A0A444YXV9_ARAHY|nr:hypothetical protein Ahy_B05g074089 [Arachis hypogaea]